MADVFLSYSSKNRETARALASALSERGLSVWWDREIVTGEAFDRAIERELDAARSVIVLWSRESADSEWVKNEAAAAAQRGVLLPVNLDGVKLPLEFRRRQTADLAGWDGDPAHEGFQALIRGVHGLVGGTERHATLTTAEPVRPRKRRTYFIPILMGLVVLAVGAYLVFPRAGKSDGLAGLVVGTYVGNVVADSKGGSRSDIEVTITRIGTHSVRVTSEYDRIGTIDIALTRVGNQVQNATGDSVFIVNLDASPPTLSLNPRHELAYQAVRR